MTLDWTTLLVALVGAVFGGGGIWLFTIGSARIKATGEANEQVAKADKAQSEVKTSELDNVQEAIKIWREMAESLKTERDEYKANFLEVSNHNTEMAMQMESIRKELAKLNTINNKMVKLLDKITPDNLTEMVDKIKKCHETE